MDEDGNFVIDVNNDVEKIVYEVDIGDDIHINLTGGNVFNSGADAAAGSTPTMLELFNNFITALEAGDHSTVGGFIDDIDGHMDNIARVRADVGARYNRLELTENRLSKNIYNFTKLMSENEDIDQAENIMLLKSEGKCVQGIFSRWCKNNSTNFNGLFKVGLWAINFRGVIYGYQNYHH